MDKIRRFVECTIPISQCNLRCSYCYVIQHKLRNTQTNDFRCSPAEIGEAFSKDRWGGLMLVNLCAFGETLLCKELPDIVYYILKEGHYINVTNNGTISSNLDKILEKTVGMHQRLCFAFSLHYMELKSKGLLQVFADNVHKVKCEGCSFLVQLNLADEYIERIDEIKQYCLDQFGAYPQIALTRREGKEIKIFTDHTEEEYFIQGNSFQSPLFDFSCRNFKIKRKEFCYAGDWSFKLDLATGNLRSCYFGRPFFNIYDNLKEPIKTMPVGNNCGNQYCVNASHFLALGVIPELKCPSYVDLRDRNKQWYTPEMRAFLSQKFYDNNRPYGMIKKYYVNKKFRMFFEGKDIRFYISKAKLRGKNALKKAVRLFRNHSF